MCNSSLMLNNISGTSDTGISNLDSDENVFPNLPHDGGGGEDTIYLTYPNSPCYDEGGGKQ